MLVFRHASCCNMMFSCRIEKAGYLRDLVMKIPSSVSNGVFLIDSNMICFEGMDDDRYSLSSFKLYSSTCIRYECEEEIEFTFDVASLCKIIKSINSVDSIEISMITPNCIKVIANYGKKSERRHFFLQWKDLTYHRLAVDMFEYDTIISLSSSEFDRICMMHQLKYKDDVTICCDYGRVRFKVDRKDLNIQYRLINTSKCEVRCSLALLNNFRRCRLDKDEMNQTTFKTLIRKLIFDDKILDSLYDAYGIMMQYTSDVIDEYWLSQTYKGRDLVMMLSDAYPLCLRHHTDFGVTEHYIAPIEDDD